MMKARAWMAAGLMLAALLLAGQQGARGAEEQAPRAADPAPAPAESGDGESEAADADAAPAVPEQVITQEGEVIPADVVEEPDLAELPVSNAARVRLDRARDSIVKIRGFLGSAETSAFHGSGFAVGNEGLIVTNYHVVSEAVLHPQRFRLEYVTSDGRTGRLQVYAVDVRNDLAVVKAQDLDLPPLRLRTDIPRQGARAYSIGYPLNLGLTITEGVANGLAAVGFDQRIHYTGAINSGMSGGPALDAGGAVYGVNVSVISGRQLVGFVVPARHVEPLLKRAQAPLEQALSAQQTRDMLAQQALAHEAAVLDPGLQPIPVQTLLGYRLPTRMGPVFECNTTASSEVRDRLRTESIQCSARAGVLLQVDLEVGHVQFQHVALEAQDLHPLQFAWRVNALADAHARQGSSRNVAPFACRNSLVSLDGFDARISTCARQYRLFSGLYDIAVVVTSVNSAERAVISQLDLRGVGFEPGMLFVRRFLGAMRWMP